jgi:hypothetical protein
LGHRRSRCRRPVREPAPTIAADLLGVDVLEQRRPPDPMIRGPSKNAVSTTTAVPGCAAAIFRVASMPSMTNVRTIMLSVPRP